MAAAALARAPAPFVLLEIIGWHVASGLAL
jgi:hypothetical protein